MQATITSVTAGIFGDGVKARVRRSSQSEALYYRSLPDPMDLQVGDLIEVKRQVNLPYLRYAGKVATNG